MNTKFFERRNLIKVKKEFTSTFDSIRYPTTYDSVVINGDFYDDNIPRLAVSTNNFKVYFFNLESFEMEDFFQDEIFVYVIKISEYHKCLISGSHFGKIKFYQIPGYKKVRELNIAENEKLERSSAILYFDILDYRTLCVCINMNPYPEPPENRGWVVFVDFETYPLSISRHDYHDGSVWVCQKMKSYDNLIITAGGDDAVRGQDFCLRIWDWKKRKCIQIFPKVHTDRVVTIITLVQSNREEYIISGSRDGRIVKFDMSGNILKIIENQVFLDDDDDEEIRRGGIYFLNNFRRDLILVGGEMGSVNIISMNQKKVILRNKKKYHSDKVYSICWIDEEKKDKFVSVSMNGFHIFKISDLLDSEVKDFETRYQFIVFEFLERNGVFFNTKSHDLNLITFFKNEIDDEKKEIFIFPSFLQM